MENLILAVLLILLLYVLLKSHKSKRATPIKQAIISRGSGLTGSKMSIKCPHCGFTLGVKEERNFLFAHYNHKTLHLSSSGAYYVCPKCRKPISIPEGILQEMGVQISTEGNISVGI